MLKKEINDINLEEILDEIPDEVANLQLPDTYLRDYYRDEENRILWLRDKIDDSTLSIAKKIVYYNKLDKDIEPEKRKPIKLFIYTLGGAVDVMYTLMNAIRMSKTPVWTINWCYAYSAGAYILAAGHRRLAMPGSTILIHTGSCQYGGTVEQAESAKKFFDSLTKKSDEKFLEFTKVDPKVFKKRAPFDWYLTEEDALENGIVDEIVTSLDILY